VLISDLPLLVKISITRILLLKPFRWRCTECTVHHKWNVCKEQHHIYVVWTSNNRVVPVEWSWWVTSNNACEAIEQLIVLTNGDDESGLVGWTLLLLAATVPSFAHMTLRLSNCKKLVLWPLCYLWNDTLYNTGSWAWWSMY